MRRAKSPFRWLRRFLLLIGLLGIAGLGVLLAAYRFGTQTGPAVVEEESPVPDDDAVTVSEQVDFVQTSGGEKVFRVIADRSIQSRDGKQSLEGVTLEVDREDGSQLRITSDRAELSGETDEASLDGNVVIVGWGDLRLESRSIDVLDHGNLMVSEGTVEIHYPPDLVGRASRMRIDKKTNMVTLDGGVHLHTVPGVEVPVRLDCKRLVYRRTEGLVRAVEDVYLKRGGEEIRAHYLSLFLQEDQRTPKVVRARWNVIGEAVNLDEAGGEIRARFEGKFLQIEPSENDPEYRVLTLEGTVEEPAELFVSNPDGLARSLTGRKLEARAYGGNMQRLEGYGDPMTMVEFLDLQPRYPLRHVCADVLKAGFLPGGELDQMYLVGQVEVSDSTIHIGGGETALVNVASGKMRIEGQAVELYSERGDIVAPKIEYSRGTGLIRAEGGVQANLEATDTTVLSGTPLEEGEGPVHVEAENATWTERPPSFAFKGGVRAWRGQNLLLAEQIRGDEATHEMAASGGVRSVWIPKPSVDALAASAASGTPAPAPIPVQVTAQTLTLRGSDNALVYIGDVLVTQQQRTIRCSELTVEMVAGGGAAERMLCRGDVRLDDPVVGNRATGDRAVYDVAGENLELFGDNVRLVDAERNEINGRYLVYDMTNGQTQVSSRVPEDRAVSEFPSMASPGAGGIPLPPDPGSSSSGATNAGANGLPAPGGAAEAAESTSSEGAESDSVPDSPGDSAGEPLETGTR